ncbi:hypothetical protein [Streptomyces sp. NPDC001389]|uniref:hypothetical protein n=1 Tax=unclassified Streptomyces TaxID=2593676 RepID=UPI00368C0967
MPIDPYAALNAMIRAEAVRLRFSPTSRKDRPAPQAAAAETAPEALETGPGGEPQPRTAEPAA